MQNEHDISAPVAASRARSLAARIAAHTSWAKTPDRSARTARARASFNERFEREVDPDGVLDPAERAKRAENARKAYYLRLAAKSAASRRRATEPDQAA